MLMMRPPDTSSGFLIARCSKVAKFQEMYTRELITMRISNLTCIQFARPTQAAWTCKFCASSIKLSESILAEFRLGTCFEWPDYRWS